MVTTRKTLDPKKLLWQSMSFVHELNLQDRDPIAELLHQRDTYFGMNRTRYGSLMDTIIKCMKDRERWHFVGYRQPNDNRLTCVYGQYLSRDFPVWRLSWALLDKESTKTYNTDTTGSMSCLQELIYRAEVRSVHTFHTVILSSEVQPRLRVIERQLRKTKFADHPFHSYTASLFWKGTSPSAPSSLRFMLGEVDPDTECSVLQWSNRTLFSNSKSHPLNQR